MSLKKLTGILTLASILGFSTNANAALLYDISAGLTVGGGAATMFADGDSDTNSAQSYGAMIGLDIPAFRFELEYNYLNDDDAKMHVAFLNAYFKMISTVVHPYLGVGVGTVFSGEVGNIDIDTKPAYQGMLGLTFDLPVLPFNFDVEARAMYAPDLYKVAGLEPDLLHYDLRLKIRYVF